MNKLSKTQIENYISHFDTIKQLPPPQKGWIKFIRNALSMTTTQLAKRLGVTRRRVVMIEQAEVENATTLKTLRNVAEAMNCKLVYAIVPKTSIHQIIDAQARKIAMKHLESVAHHMMLESQTVKDKKAMDALMEDIIQELKKKMIWDE